MASQIDRFAVPLVKVCQSKVGLSGAWASVWSFSNIHTHSANPVVSEELPAPADQGRFPSPGRPSVKSWGDSVIGMNRGHSKPIATLWLWERSLAIPWANRVMSMPVIGTVLSSRHQAKLCLRTEPMSATQTMGFIGVSREASGLKTCLSYTIKLRYLQPVRVCLRL